MGKRKQRADTAIDDIRERASSVLGSATDLADDTIANLSRRTRKARREVEKSARKAERRLGHFWNRGRFRVKRVQKKTARQIDKAGKRVERGFEKVSDAISADV